MDTRTVGDLKILIPDLDPRDLDTVEEPPDGELLEALVDGADWAGLELDTARLRLSRLVQVNLANATWRRPTVSGCRFEQVDLSGARLEDATIERCEFVGCRLTGLQLTDTTLKNVIFDNCRLDYAILTQVRTTGPTAVLDCNLDHATMTHCQLGQTVISRCQFDEVETHRLRPTRRRSPRNRPVDHDRHLKPSGQRRHRRPDQRTRGHPRPRTGSDRTSGLG